MNRKPFTVTVVVTVALNLVMPQPAAGQAASSSLMEQALGRPFTAPLRTGDSSSPQVVATSLSMFRVAPPEPRQFAKHDLVQVIVFESSRAKSEHDLELEKAWLIGGRGQFSWPGQLEENFQGDLLVNNDFEGEGEYERKDDFSTRIAVEIIEILPNGNLVLEGRTVVNNDDEKQNIVLTGICRPEDITADNTILSNQVHDLRVEKMTTGELKKTNTRNILAKLLDFIFVW